MALLTYRKYSNFLKNLISILGEYIVDILLCVGSMTCCLFNMKKKKSTQSQHTYIHTHITKF